MQGRLAADKAYVVLARDLTPDTADDPSGRAAAGVPGLGVESTQVTALSQSGGGPETRSPPSCWASSTATGTASTASSSTTRTQLAGTPRIVERTGTPNGQPIAETQRTVPAGTPGADLRLTIDASLQLAVEQEVLAAWVADRAHSVSAVVMDPYTGEV